MSIFSSLQMAGNTLQAMQIGLHVVGNNIANANTPGYVRERVIYQPAPTQKVGGLTLGTGVEIAGVVQSLDKFVEDRLRDAGSDLAGAEVQEKAYLDLQAILGELTDSDISSSLTRFFNSIGEVTKTPEDIAIRNLAVSDGVELTQRINTLSRRVQVVRQDFNVRVGDIADEINTLTEQIRLLNLRIVNIEGGGNSGSDAGGLRSQRGVAIKKLASLVDITANEQPTGAVNISVGSDVLVFGATRREVESLNADNAGVTSTEIHFVGEGGALKVSGGELGGIYEARDTIVGNFTDRLDDFASTLAFEFNKIYSQGQGKDGFSELTSFERVDDADAPLNQAGLAFTPVNGEFSVLVRNSKSDPAITTTHRIRVDLDGLDTDSTLASVAAAIDAIDGISAQLNSDNELEISADSSDLEFGFENDTSGLLAAIGINTFFTGSEAGTIGVNSELRGDSKAGAKFAAALDGFGDGSENALRLVDLFDSSLESLDGGSIRGVYDRLINDTTQGATVAQAVADGLRVFQGTLDASAQAVSGVNLDEEAIDMIMLQRTYQASARYIATLSELLETLIGL